MIIDSKKQPVFNADILKDLRIKKNMSCYELAAKCGVEKKYIYCLEKKSMKRPSFDTVAKIAYALDVNTDVFINKLSL
jgi:transcriptional regulator with XRE-family HTH domain